MKIDLIINISIIEACDIIKKCLKDSGYEVEEVYYDCYDECFTTTIELKEKSKIDDDKFQIKDTYYYNDNDTLLL